MDVAKETLHPVLAERRATEVVERKIHGLKVKLGLARSKAKRAKCLAEKLRRKDSRKLFKKN
jgi:hypothetical protein